MAVGAAVSYRPPTMTALSGNGFTNAQTEGGQTVLISGDQFGPVSVLGGAYSPLPNVTAAYGLSTDSPLRYSAGSCAVTTAQTVITCLTAPGVGFGYLWQVNVAGQVAPLLLGFPQSYAPPVTAIYSGPGSLNANTAGSELVVISGALRIVLLLDVGHIELPPYSYSYLQWLPLTYISLRRRQLRPCWNSDRPRDVRPQRYQHNIARLLAYGPAHRGAPG